MNTKEFLAQILKNQGTIMRVLQVEVYGNRKKRDLYNQLEARTLQTEQLVTLDMTLHKCVRCQCIIIEGTVCEQCNQGM